MLSARCCKCRFDKSQGNNALLAVSAPFTVQDKCVLEAEEACYCLSIESAMPIFAVSIMYGDPHIRHHVLI